MGVKLTWDDLIIQDIPEKTAQCLDLWTDLVQGLVAPVFMSKFGDWFLIHPDGSIHELSVIDGTYEQIAPTEQEFYALVNTTEWQEDHLLSYQVWQLHERGIIPKAGQCYAFAPHPVWTGRIDIDMVTIVGIIVWQNICAQTFFAPDEG